MRINKTKQKRKFANILVQRYMFKNVINIFRRVKMSYTESHKINYI